MWGTKVGQRCTVNAYSTILIVLIFWSCSILTATANNNLEPYYLPRGAAYKLLYQAYDATGDQANYEMYKRKHELLINMVKNNNNYDYIENVLNDPIDQFLKEIDDNGELTAAFTKKCDTLFK